MCILKHVMDFRQINTELTKMKSEQNWEPVFQNTIFLQYKHFRFTAIVHLPVVKDKGEARLFYGLWAGQTPGFSVGSVLLCRSGFWTKTLLSSSI